jgi:hypothetical protein
MPRATKADPRLARLRRDTALQRAELRGPSEARVSPKGATSFPIKIGALPQDVVDEWFAKKNARCSCAEPHDRPYWNCPKHGNVAVEP